MDTAGRRASHNQPTILSVVGVLVAVLLAGVLPRAAEALPQLSARKFASSATCSCHRNQTADWSRSLHAQAYFDPIFTLKKKEAVKAGGVELGIFCDRCHTPIGTMAGQTAPGKKLSAQSKEGVTCDFCHQVTGTEKPLGNASQKLKANGTKRAQFDDASAPSHKTAYSRFHTTAEFCAACHYVTHPVNGLELDSTYREWKEGPYAALGMVCQDCHMSTRPQGGPSAGQAAPMGPVRDFIYQMNFVGANVGMGNAQLATANLKSAARVSIEASEVIDSGSVGRVNVVVRNVGAGHYLPGGSAEIRDMWLEVNAILPDGSSYPIGDKRFGTVFEDAKGNEHAEIWDAVAVASDNRIPPKGEDRSDFEFTMRSANRVTLEAVLRYRSFPDQLAKKAKVTNPITEMARSSTYIYGSDESRRLAEKDERSSLSWLLPWLLLAAALLVAGGVVAYVVRRRRRNRGAGATMV